MNYDTMQHLSNAQSMVNGTSLVTYLVSANTDM